ncbi:MAG: hypothetical protein PHS15_07325, partial [Clostridiaceae bacterium]|nr:hypothetical protein [Clostridiaceae bacterium]
MNKSIFAFFSVVVLTVAIAVDCLDVNTDGTFVSREKAEGKTVMIIADYLDIEDINRMEYLHRLAGESYVALMNNRQPGKAGAGKSKLIIGTGKRLELNSDTVSGGSADIYKVRNRNADSEYLNYIGYIGDVINKNNGVACFIGNADTADQNRSSMLIAMDSNGEVDLGETENTNIDDEFFPYGIRTDYNRLAELYKQYLPASSFMVIETGDMERLEVFRASMSEESYEFYKQSVLKNIDSFIKAIVDYSDYKTLIFISTYPSKSDAEANNRLTPVVVHEAGKGGVLYSSNTRREGIILNTDLADYILFKLGYIKNSAVEEFERKKTVNLLEDMNRNIVRTSSLRAPVLTFYAVMMIEALGILFAFVAFFRKVHKSVWTRLSIFLSYIMLSFPIALL